METTGASANLDHGWMLDWSSLIPRLHAVLVSTPALLCCWVAVVTRVRHCTGLSSLAPPHSATLQPQ